MKRFLSWLLIALLVPMLASAQSVPVNPMATRGESVYITPTPSPEPTPEPFAAPTAEPTSEPAAEAPTEPTATVMAAPAEPEDDYLIDDMLDAETIARLDEEVRDYLIGTGELMDSVEGVRNILLVGVDARPGETKSRSDTIIILTIDGNNNVIKLTSLLRDLYVSIPDHGNNRINVAWVYGEFDLLRQTIRENFGLDVTEYVEVDLTLLVDLIDQIGGLTLNVASEKQRKAINGVIDAYNYQFHEPNNDGLVTSLGEQLLNGKQVMAYARYRKIDSDFKRSERQREVLSKIFDKIKGMSLIELTRLAAYAVDRVKTNLSLNDVVSLIPVMYGMKDAPIEQLTLPYDGEYQSRTVSGMAVLVPNLSAAQARLEAFIYG